MNNKAFTMIEVVAVIALLGVIVIIALPNFFSSRDEAKLKEKEKIVDGIINAGAQYFTNNEITVGGEVHISTLCAEDYLKCPIKNPVTNNNMNGYVKIINNAEGIQTYKYFE